MATQPNSTCVALLVALRAPPANRNINKSPGFVLSMEEVGNGRICHLRRFPFRMASQDVIELLGPLLLQRMPQETFDGLCKEAPNVADRVKITFTSNVQCSNIIERCRANPCTVQ